MTLLTPKSTKSFLPSVFSDFFDNDDFLSPKWMNWVSEQSMPAVNITENDKEFRLEMAAPGYEKKDFSISVDNDMLKISAEKEEEMKTDKDSFCRREFSYRSFERSFRLPKAVEGDTIDANYEQGLLKVRLPKKQEAPTKTGREIPIA